jgi:hypothetical protein
MLRQAGGGLGQPPEVRWLFAAPAKESEACAHART